MCGQFDCYLHAIDSTDVNILVKQTELASVIALPRHVRLCRRIFLLLNNVLRAIVTWRSVGRSVGRSIGRSVGQVLPKASMCYF